MVLCGWMHFRSGNCSEYWKGVYVLTVIGRTRRMRLAHGQVVKDRDYLVDNMQATRLSELVGRIQEEREQTASGFPNWETKDGRDWGIGKVLYRLSLKH